MEDIPFNQLFAEAWKARQNAFLISGGTTKVGSAVLSSSGQIFSGCNIQHQFRTHDIHAEVCAISKMISAGETRLIAIVVVADRKLFTPCGSCMDWIMQQGGGECIIGFESAPNSQRSFYKASELMPFYPN